MILYTLNNKNSVSKMFKIYIGVSIFCVILWKIYGNFSHGVSSIYMTYLFAWPLIMGALVNLVFMVIKKLPRPGSFSVNLYNSGVAALTVSSLLRGIFEIAGTACYLQTYLYNVGRLEHNIIIWRKCPGNFVCYGHYFCHVKKYRAEYNTANYEKWS